MRSRLVATLCGVLAGVAFALASGRSDVILAASQPSETFVAVPSPPVTVSAGSSVILTLSVSPSATFQWKFNEADIVGATSPTLAVNNIGMGQAGTYSLAIRTGSSSSTASVLLKVSVNAKLSNISTRASVRPDRSLTAGFVVGGSGVKQVLLRGIGPTLQAFGVADALSSSELTLFSKGTTLVEAQAWGDGQVVSDALKRLGAFAFDPSSADSALLWGIDSGSYSAVLTSSNGSSGLALVEVYDAGQLFN